MNFRHIVQGHVSEILASRNMRRPYCADLAQQNARDIFQDELKADRLALLSQIQAAHNTPKDGRQDGTSVQVGHNLQGD